MPASNGKASLMPSKEAFAKVINARFAKLNGQEIPESWLTWAYLAFQMGYHKGQDDFMKSHDWYE